jgi:hypothetical protein
VPSRLNDLGYIEPILCTAVCTAKPKKTSNGVLLDGLAEIGKRLGDSAGNTSLLIFGELREADGGVAFLNVDVVLRRDGGRRVAHKLHRVNLSMHDCAALVPKVCLQQ